MTILSRGGCLRMTLAAVWLTTQPRLQSAALLAVTSTVALRLIASLRASATVELISIEAFLTLCDCRNGRIEVTARSEERRVGQECVSPCRSRWTPSH